MKASEFDGTIITGVEDRARAMCETVAAHVDTRRIRSVLEIGCGSGMLAGRLKDMLPGAKLIGIDLSEENVLLARRSELREGTLFERVDYLNLRRGSFDLIVSDQTLHNIDAPTDALFSKLFGDLTEGGVCVMTLPSLSPVNAFHWALRRSLALVRSSTTDRLILLAAKALLGRRYDERFLAERIVYMYHTPKRWNDPALRSLLARLGFTIVEVRRGKTSTFWQPRFDVIVLRRN